ncbi:uncharacterized protein M6B38_410995 [Iris pallida]|uniref:Reverse transcriptase domain-containing protein n=1 Tax=Iris pallida TaxID=29817 RepID=A0AAX6FML8_IRIPA|nr:uncharacterized protein M6B38_410995 [Iris pallida]
MARIWVRWSRDSWDGDLVLKTQQIIGILLVNKGGFRFLLGAVYGHNDRKRRESLWEDIARLGQMADSQHLPLLIMGDFNALLYRHEKVGGRPVQDSILYDFQRCLLISGLRGLERAGHIWTWHNKASKGRVACQLDRALGNSEWFRYYPNAVAEGLAAETSDHSPIRVGLLERATWKARPFRYNNSWFLSADYEEVVARGLLDSREGTAQFRMVHKLKQVKRGIRDWVKRKPRSSLADKEAELREVQEALQADILCGELAAREKDLSAEVNSLRLQEEISAAQRAKCSWLKDGDRCTKFFYDVIRTRQHRNSIPRLLDGEGKLVGDPVEIQREAVRFYRDLYHQEDYPTTFPPLIPKRLVTQHGNRRLLAPIRMEEIEDIVMKADPNRAPGPDGFSSGFFRRHWGALKLPVLEAVQEFFLSGKLLKELNHTFLTLVPKKEGATSLADFRPIACCNYLYKIITHLMCRRMEGIMQGLVSRNQAAFIKGRSIAEHSLLAHEMVREFNKPGGMKACVKLDLRKAYDTVNRDFLCQLMLAMGFDERWVARVRECICSPTFSVLIQGTPYGFFSSSRGLRQGDPLSPYLFTLVMEYFTCLMDLAVHSRRIVPLFRLVHPVVSHLIYADDLLVLLRPSMGGMRALSDIMEEFGRLSGLKLNREKSRVYFSSSCPQKEERALVLGVEKGELPVKYLGVPLTVNYAREQDCQSLVEFTKKRVEGWQAAGLSFGGRIELLRSVIAGIAMFWLQSIQIPVATITKVESMCADFLWRGGIHAISWTQLCRPREEGGVGLRSLRAMKEAARVKMAWQFIGGGSLWADWMASRYLRRSNFWTSRIDNNFSVTFKAILKCRPVLQTAICRSMRDGSSTDLWLDPWLGNRSLLEYLGPLHDREASRGLKCSLIIRDGAWRPELYTFTAQLGEEIRTISIDTSQSRDTWNWVGHASSGGPGRFSFKSCYDLVRTRHDRIEDIDFIWGKGISRKMQLCSYRLMLGRLMTRDRLIRFGVPIPDSRCLLCSDVDESMTHLFFECPLAWHIWSEQCRRYLGGAGSVRDIRGILSWIRDRRGMVAGWARQARLRLSATVWHVWRERNRRFFEGLITPPIGILHNIDFDVSVLTP